MVTLLVPSICLLQKRSKNLKPLASKMTMEVCSFMDFFSSASRSECAVRSAACCMCHLVASPNPLWGCESQDVAVSNCLRHPRSPIPQYAHQNGCRNVGQRMLPMTCCWPYISGMSGDLCHTGNITLWVCLLKYRRIRKMHGSKVRSGCRALEKDQSPQRWPALFGLRKPLELLRLSDVCPEVVPLCSLWGCWRSIAGLTVPKPSNPQVLKPCLQEPRSPKGERKELSRK